MGEPEGGGAGVAEREGEQRRLGMLKKIGVVHCIAECHDCGKEFTGYKNAQALAARHAKLYSHTVSGEVGIHFEYGPDSKSPGLKLSEED